MGPAPPWLTYRQAVEFRVLGPLEVVDESGLHVQLGGPKERAVLSMLLIDPCRPVSAGHLIDQLWGEAPPRTATNTLQTYVSHLRRSLGADTGGSPLVKRSGGYVLDVEPESIDRVRFDRLVEAGQLALAAGDPEGASRALRAALDLWRGPALTELPDTPATTGEVARLEEQRLAAVEDRVEADLALGRHRGLVGELERHVAEHPLRERLRAQLALALYRSERQAEALRVLERGRQLLLDQLGLDPGPALMQLDAAILTHDPALRLEAASPVSGAVAVPGPAASTPEGRRARSVDERTPLFGRADELAHLELVVAEADAGRGRLVLVGGEPGIGKTRLVEEALARGQVATVLWGRCLEDDAAPPFWPWVQIVRALPGLLDDDERERVVRPVAAELSRLVPELKEDFDDVEPPPLYDPETDRFRLYDAVARVLRDAGATRLVAVVLDDLQWADAPSLRLLRFLADGIDRSRLVVLGTYRDTEVDAGHPLADLTAALAADRVLDRIQLRGLAPDELAAVVGAELGADPDEATIERLAARTAGNPFFLHELLRAHHALGEAGDFDALPTSVGEVIRRRIGALPGDPGEVLAMAAILGREFTLRVVVALAERGDDEVLDALEAAMAAGLVVEVPERVGRFRFTHDLVREALLAPVSATRRARLHARAAHAYEELGGPDPTRLLAELAFHWCAAGEVGDPKRAVQTATDAASRALAGLAFEDAADLARRALVALELLPADPVRRCDLLLLLGDAHRRAGALAEARPVLEAALAEARHLDDAERFARIACSFSGGSLFGAMSEWGRVDSEVIDLLGEALDRLGPADTRLRARC